MKNVKLLSAAIVTMVVGSSAPALSVEPQAPPPPAPNAAPSSSPYVIPFEKYTLDNGLEVILHHDASLPVVAVNVWYHVGPANEAPSRSGFAHLFEHLMFEGSKHVGKNFDRLLEEAGATNVNGTTSWDRTNYFETVPREHLELALWLESDRMGFMLDMLSKERLDVQRDVVMNERRQSHENAPYGPSELAMYDNLYPKGHPYNGAIIGSMEDLARASIDDVRAFFQSFYTPSNATIAIAGDFDAGQVRGWIQQYFGTLESHPKPQRRVIETPPITSEKRVTVDEPVQLARVTMAWITPPAFTKDDAVLDIVSSVLAGGKATRLYQELVVTKKICPDVDSWHDSNQLASTFAIDATAATGASTNEIEKAIDAVLDRLVVEGPTEDEMQRAKRGVELSVRRSLQRLNGEGGESGRAGFLQRLNHYLNDPGALPRVMAETQAVTATDVSRAVRQYLQKSSRVLVVTRPRATAGAKGSGQ